MDYGLVFGRRFRALKLWFVMRYFGRDGLVALLRDTLRKAAWLGQQIKADTRFDLVAPSSLGLVCFRLREGDAVTKIRLSKDKTTLTYNQFLTLTGIPLETYEYRLGNRSALEWVIDQYQISTDKRSGITNDPNRGQASWHSRDRARVRHPRMRVCTQVVGPVGRYSLPRIVTARVIPSRHTKFLIENSLR